MIKIKRKKTFLLLTSLGILLLVLGIVGACKSKSQEALSGGDEGGDAEIDHGAIPAPAAISLKSPALSPSFVTTPMFTVEGVEAGDTVRLFKDPSCQGAHEIGLGVVEEGQNQIDITVESLTTLGTYLIYANRTNAAGKTSSCSPNLSRYHLVGCPAMYVPVEGNAEMGEHAFCAMSTEAKKDANNLPAAQYAGNPWVNLTIVNAKKACRKLTTEYMTCDLLSNRQWMTMARDIEANPVNWSGGVVGSGTLNRGHSDNSPTNVLSVLDPNDPWDQTEDDESTWTQKRTHVLSNGSVIWDMAGNVQEWVDWTTGELTLGEGPKTCVHEWKELLNVSCGALTPADYLPANPAELAAGNYRAQDVGIGKFHGGSGGFARRSGDWEQDFGGIFFMNLLGNSSANSQYIGFRCGCTVVREQTEIGGLPAPRALSLKSPALSPTFSRTATFTVSEVDPGDTVRIFTDPFCQEAHLFGSGVVASGATAVDIVIPGPLNLGKYFLYTNRTNAAGETSACSPRLFEHQVITCPDESYVPVPSNVDLGVADFCVMRTEAKANTLSKNEGAPSVWNTAPVMKSKCQALSSLTLSCDLISNRQWMAIARNIESTAANWSGGMVGVGTLNRGHSDNAPANALSISDPTDPWDQTGEDEATWLQKRTHILSNGSVIWDLGGNVSEFVDWETGGVNFASAPKTCPEGSHEWYELECADFTANDYAPLNPAGILPEEYTGANYGIGKIVGTTDALRNSENQVAVYRSGFWDSGVRGGIYGLWLNGTTTVTSAGTGFRCVCNKFAE